MVARRLALDEAVDERHEDAARVVVVQADPSHEATHRQVVAVEHVAMRIDQHRGPLGDCNKR